MPWPVWLTQEWWWLQFVLSYCPSDVSVKCVAWIWQDWSGELSRQMLYELGCYNFFFRKAVAFVVCFMHAKVGSHLGIFECPVFFVVFFLLCLCMHDIHNMHDHALCFSVGTNVAKLVCITFMKHACMHASSTSCMWLGDIWLRLVLWYGSFWAGITFGYRMGQHGWSQGKSPAAFHRPGFQEQQDQTE